MVFQIQLFGTVKQVISNALRMKVGWFFTFKFLLSSAFRGMRSFSFFRERFVHQDRQLHALAFILKFSSNELPKTSVEATLLLHNSEIRTQLSTTFEYTRLDFQKLYIT